MVLSGLPKTDMSSSGGVRGWSLRNAGRRQSNCNKILRFLRENATFIVPSYLPTTLFRR